MECLAERTIARETRDRTKDPSKGYTPVLLERMEAIFPPALAHGIKLVINMGAANPIGAARAARKHAKGWGCRDDTCAIVQGGEVRAGATRLGEAGRRHGEICMRVRLYDLAHARRREGQHVQHFRHRL